MGESSLPLSKLCIRATRDRIVNGGWKQLMKANIYDNMAKKIKICSNEKNLIFDQKIITDIIEEVMIKRDSSIFGSLEHAFGIYNMNFCQDKQDFEHYWYALFYFTLKNCINAHINDLCQNKSVIRINFGKFEEEIKVIKRNYAFEDVMKRWQQHVCVHDILKENQKHSFYYIKFLLDLAHDIYNLPIDSIKN